MQPRMDLETAKQLLPLDALWLRLGLPGEPPERDGKLVSCPFKGRHPNGDRRPSFNFYGGGLRFKCFACGAAGGAVDMVALALELDERAACRKLLEMAGGAGVEIPLPAPKPKPKPAPERAPVKAPPLGLGTFDERRALAESRGVSMDAVSLALGLGVLRFGDVCGFPCWLVLDGAMRAVEARRLDRLPFPALGGLGERKAHSLRGTDKSWPVGADLLRRGRSIEARVAGLPPKRLEMPPPEWRAIMLVEGGPDLLAALHLLHEAEVGDVLPVALLGRCAGGAIHSEALGLLAGKRVRIYPHADSDGGGLEAAAKWAAQLAGAGCHVDAVSFAGRLQANGQPVNDLNDWILSNPTTQEKRQALP
jgi:hypothetical protein